MKTGFVAIVMIAFFVMPSAAFADDTYVTLWQRKMTPAFTSPQYSFSAMATRQPTFIKNDYRTDVTIRRHDLQIMESAPGYVNIQVRQPELNIRSAPMAVYFAANFQPNFGAGLRLPSLTIPLKELPTADLDSCAHIRIRDMNMDFPCDTECNGCNDCGNQYLRQYNNAY